MGRYWRPTELATALAILAESQPAILAGGTWARAREPAFPPPDILDVTAIAALRGVAPVDGGWRIGAATPWAAILEAPLPRAFAALVEAGRLVGGPQVQNRGTIGGNILAGNPSSDGLPALLALGARLEIAGPGGARREVPVTALSEGAAILAPGELLAAILLPAPPPQGVAASGHRKLGFRAAVNIGVVTVAGFLAHDAGRIVEARIALGACTQVAQRLPAVEDALRRQGPDPEAILPAHLADVPLRPDWTAPDSYRREAARVLLRRLVADLARDLPA